MIRKVKRIIKKILKSNKKVINKNVTKAKEKKVNLFSKIPSLSISEICELSGIEIPSSYVRKKNLLINNKYSKQRIRLEEKSMKYVKKLRFQLGEFVKKFYTQDIIEKDENKLLEYIIEWIYIWGKRGFTYNEYFDYELYNKDKETAATFLNGKYRNEIHGLCNKKEDRIILKDKAIFNKTYSKYVKRAWVDTTTCTFNEFEEFIKKFPVHFGKPVRGTGGEGAGILDATGKDLKELFKEYNSKSLIIEEVVKQHKDLAKFNESSLNTIRLYSLLCADGKARVLLAIIRLGRKGSAVDNFHGGGVSAIIDVNTGIVSSDAINRAHVKFLTHPDSNLPIKGFKLPNWDKVIASIEDAATIVPTLRHIGWDLAITDKGEVELIEGNSWPNFDVPQVADQTGKKHYYEKYIDELKELREKEKEKEKGKK